MKARKRRVAEVEYDVGYGRPPARHQFKKGQPSPNPKGRPRGSRNTNLAAVLHEPVSITIQGRTKKVPYLDAWLQVTKDRALKGDLKAGQMIIMLAKAFKMLDVPDIDDDFILTLNVTKEPPPELLRRFEK